MKEQLIGDLTSYITGQNPDTPPKNAVILIHGYGANGRDLLSLGQTWQAAMPETIFIAPDAPTPCAGTPFGREWFPITDLQQETMERDIGNAWTVLNDFIEAVKKKYALTDDKIVLCGFSQGTMMSLHTALHRPNPLAGLLGYSGMLLSNSLPTNPKNTSIPICLIHGEEDSVIPYTAWHDAYGRLKNAGFEPTGYTTPNLEHGIDERGLIEGVKFLQTCLY